jgi:hypothetical protein
MHLATEAQLNSVPYASTAFENAVLPASRTEKPPRKKLRAADRPPNERQAQTPQFARLTKTDEIYLVDEIEFRSPVELLSDFVCSPLPSPVRERVNVNVRNPRPACVLFNVNELQVLG